MGDFERCTFDDDEFERTFGVETRAWDCWRGSAHKRQHARLFSFVKGTDSAYNDWAHDDGRASSKRGITQMMAPEDIAARFYGQHWRAELQSAAQSQVLLGHGGDSSDADDNAAPVAFFWRTWAADARRAAHSGATPLQSAVTARDHVTALLAFECDPLNCSDPSARNDYGSIFQQQQRQLASYNPFTRFANSVLNYVSSRTTASRWKQYSDDADGKIYVESTLARHMTTHCMSHVEWALSADHEFGTAEAPVGCALPPLEPGALHDRWKRALEEVRSPFSAKGGSAWANVQRALRLDAPAAINDFVHAWSAVEHAMQRAGMFDRSERALNTPFSTLYDYGVHCVRASNVSGAHCARESGTLAAASPKAHSEPCKDQNGGSSGVPLSESRAVSGAEAAKADSVQAATARAQAEEHRAMITVRIPKEIGAQSQNAQTRGCNSVVAFKKPSMSKVFAQVGVTSKRKRRRVAENRNDAAPRDTECDDTTQNQRAKCRRESNQRLVHKSRAARKPGRLSH